MRNPKKIAPKQALASALRQAGPVLPGRREENKQTKLNNIKSAALELFLSKSFDETTTREIAAAAGVAMGTLFLYADNKRDLLFLISNDHLRQINKEAEAEAAMKRPVLASFLHVFRLHYLFFGKHPELSRAMLREMIFYGTGKQSLEFQAIRSQLLTLLTKIARRGQKNAELRSDADAANIAWIMFSIYQVEIRRWLMGEQPDAAAGMRQLKKSLALCLSGLSQKKSQANI